MGEDFREKNPDFVAELTERKLDNSACLAVELEFCQGEADCTITHAELLFGSKLKAGPKKKTKQTKMKRVSVM
jgi:hypothetical protein